MLIGPSGLVSMGRAEGGSKVKKMVSRLILLGALLSFLGFTGIALSEAAGAASHVTLVASQSTTPDVNYPPGLW